MYADVPHRRLPAGAIASALAVGAVCSFGLGLKRTLPPFHHDPPPSVTTWRPAPAPVVIPVQQVEAEPRPVARSAPSAVRKTSTSDVAMATDVQAAEVPSGETSAPNAAAEVAPLPEVAPSPAAEAVPSVAAEAHDAASSAPVEPTAAPPVAAVTE